jgi:hypothetical protein
VVPARRRHGGDILVAGYLGGEEDVAGAEFVEEGLSHVVRLQVSQRGGNVDEMGSADGGEAGLCFWFVLFRFVVLCSSE